MKRIIPVTIILLLFPLSLSSQDSGTQKIKYYNAWISINNDPGKVKGLLYEINDSSVSLSNLLNFTDHTTGFTEPVNIDFSNIDVIKIQKDRKVAKSVMTGMITGFIIGGISGPLIVRMGASQPPFATPAQWTASVMIPGAGLAICGSIAGGLIGSFKIKIPVNGSFNKFNDSRNRLKNYSIRK